MPNPSNFRLPLVLLALAASVAASADQIVRTYTATDPMRFYFAQFDAFDSALGTLNSVTLSLDLQSEGGASILNRGPDAQNQILSSGVNAGIRIYRRVQPNEPNRTQTIAGAGVEGLSNYTEGVLATGESFSQSLDFSGSQDSAYAIGNDGVRYVDSTGVFTGAALGRFNARYAGDQTYIMHYVYAYRGYSLLSNLTATYDFEGALKTTITYDYTPVPEPASCAALGLGALVALKRRKKA